MELATWAAPAASVLVWLGGIWYLSRQGRESRTAAAHRRREDDAKKSAEAAARDQALERRDEALGAEIRLLSTAMNKLSEVVTSQAKQYAEHEKDCAVFRAQTVQAMEGVKEALKALAQNVTDIALIRQQLQSHEDKLAWGTGRFNELERGLMALARGEHFVAAGSGVETIERRQRKPRARASG
jgi:hypothetical protein